MSKKESLEEWFKFQVELGEDCPQGFFMAEKCDPTYLGALEAWSHQQKKIDQLEAKLKTENVSHNYHCKESQRKNDVIDQLEKTIEKHVFELDVLGGDLLLGGHQMIAKRFKELRKKLMEKV